MNKREKGIRVKKQRQLIKTTQAQLTRLTDDVVSALKNLKLYQWHGDDKKVDSAADYLIEALEQIVNIRYAVTEMNHRYWRIRAFDREKAERLRLFESSPPPFTVPLPEDFFTPYTSTETVLDGEQGEEA